jgi:hypothetical protein
MTNVADPIRKRAYDAAYYEANRERLKAYNRRYYAANRSRISETRTAARLTAPEIPLLQSAKERAAKLGLPFDLTAADITIPDKCPVLGIPLSRGSGRCHANSPSIDRLDPSLGYVRGNVAVISHRANTIKNDATLAELSAVLRWLEERSVIK